MVKRRRRFALLVPVLLVATTAMSVTTASSAPASFSAKATCAGVVSFTASSAAATVAGANPKVGVYYSTDGANFVPVADDSQATITSKNGVLYAFNAANKYTFSDSFALPNHVGATPITLKIKTLGTWGDGTTTAYQQTVAMTVPAPCGSSSVAINPPVCNANFANVVLRNTTALEISYDIWTSANASAPYKSIPVSTGEQNTAAVPLNGPTTIAVKVAGQVLAQNVVRPFACASNPTATTTPRTTTSTTTAPAVVTVPGANAALAEICQPGSAGWSGTFTNTSGAPETFDMNRNGETLDSVTVDPGQVGSKNWTFAQASVASGTAAVFDVTTSGQIIASATVKNDCVDATVDVSLDCNSVAGSGALLAFTNQGKMPEVFTVTRDGQAVAGSPLTLEPSSMETQRLLTLDRGQTATIEIVGQESGLDLKKTVTWACAATPSSGAKTQVLSETVSRSGTLADTGFDVWPWTLSVIVLIGAGYALVRTGRYLEPPTTMRHLRK